MAKKQKLTKGDIVRVRRCEGLAVIEKHIRKYGVYLLDRPMAVCFEGDGDASFNTYVEYWTFQAKDLRKVFVE